MLEENKVTDAFDAESVVRRTLEAQYGDKIKEITFSKAWYSAAGTREFWDVEGVINLKKGDVKRKAFDYQVDPGSGRIMGYQETAIR